MNKIMLIGNVGKEPDLRYYDADQAVATFSLATTERGYTLPNGTVVPDRTDWHNVVLWRGLAKVAEKYIHKGDKLYVEGKMQYRTYNDQKGHQHFVAEVIGENIELLTSRNKVDIANDNKSALTTEKSSNSGNIAKEEAANNSDIPF